MEPRSPTLQTDFLPAEQPGKPKNIGVGSLSLLADLPDKGIEQGSPALADSLPAELPGKPHDEIKLATNQRWTLPLLIV